MKGYRAELASESAEAGRAWTVVVDPASPYFEGHFEGRPVLPAVAELQLVRELLREAGTRLELRRIPHLRFRATVAPGDRLRLALGPLAQGGLCSLSIERGEECVARGQLVLVEAGDA